MSREPQRNARTYFIRGTIAAVVLLIAFYTLFELRHLITGPVVAVSYPQNGVTVTEALIEIRGSTKNVAYLTLNDRQIFVDSKGNLREPLLLAVGYNVLRLAAKDRFGRKVEHVLEVMMEERTASTTAQREPLPSL